MTTNGVEFVYCPVILRYYSPGKLLCCSRILVCHVLHLPQDMPGKGLGHFFGAMRIDAFRPAEDFKSHMDNWITRFRNAKPANGLNKVLIPGDPEREMEAIRMSNGIPLVDSVVAELNKVGAMFGIPL